MHMNFAGSLSTKTTIVEADNLIFQVCLASKLGKNSDSVMYWVLFDDLHCCRISSGMGVPKAWLDLPERSKNGTARSPGFSFHQLVGAIREQHLWSWVYRWVLLPR